MSYKRSRGTAGYANSGDWTWEHWPPPFTQWGPSDPAPQPSPYLGGGGLGCSSCSGGCGDPMGLGQTSSGGLFGTGLFAGGLSPSTWGVGEWAVVALGGYAGIKLIGANPSVKSGGKRARRAAAGATSGVGEVVIYGALAYGAWWAYNQYEGTAAAGVSGFGDYQAQGYATPQILASPRMNSQLQIPVGW